MKLRAESKEALKYFLSKKWKALALIAALSLLVAFFESLATFALYPVLSLVTPETTGQAQNPYLKAAMDWIVGKTSFTPIHLAVALLLALTVFKLILSYGNVLLIWVTANKICQETQMRMMSSLLSADYQFLLNAQKGDLAYRVLTAPGYVSKMINVIPNMMVESLKTLMLLLMLFVISPTVTLFLVVVASLYFALARLVASNVSYGTGSGRARSASLQSVHAMNALKGIKAIRLFGVAKYWADLFGDQCRNFYNFARKDAMISGLPAMLLELVSIAFLCTLALYFASNWNTLVSNIPVIGVFAFSMLKMMPSLKQVSSYGMEVMSMLPHAEAAYGALRESESHQISGGNGRLEMGNFRSKIGLENIHFSYANTSRPVLHGVTGEIRKGQYIGIIGLSGSGKTTLLDLLAGLLSASSGRVLIDGNSIDSFSPESLSRHIGYVGQDPFLFNDTIRNNVLFGRRNPGDDAIRDALRKAGVLDFIESLSGGLEYKVADDGMSLSGGQKQRISIARALLMNPEILLLDEATSALDHQTEDKILETIQKLVRENGNTVIFVTHRKNAVQDADQIIEIVDGRVAAA